MRKKIEDDPSRPEYLLTDAYVGYRFREGSSVPMSLPIAMSESGPAA